MHGCESWTVKKAGHQRIDAFELWCWRRRLRVPWTARRFNQSILKEISPGCSLEGMMLKLKLQSVLWPPHAKSWFIGKNSDAVRDWGQEEKGTAEDEMAGWHHWLDGHESEWIPGVGDGQGGLACCDSWDRKESDTTKTSREALFLPPSDVYVRSFFHLFYTLPKLLHRRSEWSSLITGPGLNSPPEAKNPGVFLSWFSNNLSILEHVNF